MPIFRSLGIPKDIPLHEKDLITNNLPEIQPLVPKYLNQSLRKIPPLEISNWTIFFIVLIVAAIVFIIVGVLCYCLHSQRKEVVAMRTAMGTLSAGSLKTSNFPIPSFLKPKDDKNPPDLEKTPSTAAWSSNQPERVDLLSNADRRNQEVSFQLTRTATRRDLQQRQERQEAEDSEDSYEP
jgi:hypothetical protein